MNIDKNTLATLGFAFNRNMYYAMLLEGIIETSADYHKDIMTEIKKSITGRNGCLVDYINDTTSKYNDFKDNITIDDTIASLNNQISKLDSYMLEISKYITIDEYNKLYHAFEYKLNNLFNTLSNESVLLKTNSLDTNLPNNRIYEYAHNYYIKYNGNYELIHRYDERQYKILKLEEINNYFYNKQSEILNKINEEQQEKKLGSYNSLQGYEFDLKNNSLFINYYIDGNKDNNKYELFNWKEQKPEDFNVDNYEINLDMQYPDDISSITTNENENEIIINYEDGKRDIIESKDDIVKRSPTIFNNINLNPFKYYNNDIHIALLTDITNNANYIEANLAGKPIKFNKYISHHKLNSLPLKFELNDVEYYDSSMSYDGLELYNKAHLIYDFYSYENGEPYKIELDLPGKYLFANNVKIQPEIDPINKQVTIKGSMNLIDPKDNNRIIVQDTIEGSYNFNYKFTGKFIHAIKDNNDNTNRSYEVLYNDGTSDTINIKLDDHIYNVREESFDCNNLSIAYFENGYDKERFQILHINPNIISESYRLDGQHIVNTFSEQHVEYSEQIESTYYIKNYIQTNEDNLLTYEQQKKIINYHRLPIKQQLKYDKGKDEFIDTLYFGKQHSLERHIKRNFDTFNINEIDTLNNDNKTIKVLYDIDYSGNKSYVDRTVSYSDNSKLVNVYEESNNYKKDLFFVYGDEPYDSYLDFIKDYTSDNKIKCDAVSIYTNYSKLENSEEGFNVYSGVLSNNKKICRIDSGESNDIRNNLIEKLEYDISEYTNKSYIINTDMPYTKTEITIKFDDTELQLENLKGILIDNNYKIEPNDSILYIYYASYNGTKLSINNSELIINDCFDISNTIKNGIIRQINLEQYINNKVNLSFVNEQHKTRLVISLSDCHFDDKFDSQFPVKFLVFEKGTSTLNKDNNVLINVDGKHPKCTIMSLDY